MSEVDLLIYTYQTLLPSISAVIGTTRSSASKLLQDIPLSELQSMQSDLNEIASEISTCEKDLKALYYSKIFLQTNEQEKITLDQAKKAVFALSEVKKLKPEANIDTNSCIEELISNLDSVISESSLDDLFNWAKFVNSIPQSLSSQDNFLPILSIRIKSILWNMIQTDTMEGHIELATALAKCMSYKDVDLSDMIDIISDQCIDFIETTNDVNEIERNIGNLVQPDPEGTSRLLVILSSVELSSKESQKKLENLRNHFHVQERLQLGEEVRLNQITSMDEVVFNDRVIYHRQPNQAGVEVLIRAGRLQSGIQVAVKIYNARNQGDLEEYKKEPEALKLLSGKKKCFLLYFGHFLKGNQLSVVMELCSRTLGEDIFNRKRENRPFSLDERIGIMNDLLEGFTIMRQRKILHQDIKPANIMFAANGTVKIIDFNVNITINDVEASEITQNVFVQGTRNWMSPEMLKAHLNQVSGGPARAQIKPGKSDIFSLGLVFLNLFTFDDLGGKNLEENNQSLLDLVRAKVDHEGCQNLMLKMLNKDPSKRPSFNKALAEMPGKTTRNN